MKDLVGRSYITFLEVEVVPFSEHFPDNLANCKFKVTFDVAEITEKV